MTYPEYLGQLAEWIDEDSFDLLIELEDSFRAVGYDGHQDEIHTLFMNTEYIDANEILFRVRGIYREAMEAVGETQGVTLVSPDTDNFNDLVRITTALILLGTQPLEDILLDFICEDADDDYVVVCGSIAHVSELSDGLVMSYVSDVSNDAAEHLRTHIGEVEYEDEDIHSESDDYVLNRFKSVMSSIPNGQDSFVTRYIKSVNRVGIEVDTMISSMYDEIEDITDIDELADSIKLISAASGYKDSDLNRIADSIAERIHLEESRLLKVSAILNRGPIYVNDET